MAVVFRFPNTTRSLLIALPKTPSVIDAFIKRWTPSGGAEHANYAAFLLELCEVLGLPRYEATQPDEAKNSYVLEKTVYEQDDTGTAKARRIDLYKRGCFVLEAKQGVRAEAEAEEKLLPQRGGRKKKGHGTRGTAGWDTFMRRAREQAEAYARLLPPEEGRPPFVLVVDVGYVIEVYSEFTRTGGMYRPFPDAKHHRITLEDLKKPETQARLRAIWTDPMSLDPSLKAAKATRAVAATLAKLSRSMEGQADADGKPLTPERVSGFVMRMIFTMFAEDVGLIPREKFKAALRELLKAGKLDAFAPMVSDIWQHMAKGGYSLALGENIPYFNGGLFEDTEVLSVTLEQLRLLTEAAEHDWSEVEPSIFGTLVERALDPLERERLGAHYTPRAYVERLVNWTVMQPLRDDWRNVQAVVQTTLQEKGEQKGRAAARELLKKFLADLKAVKVLDPACGTGNFLYVSLELIKRLEAEVVETLVNLGGMAPLAQFGVGPEEFLGIELNPRAARVAELVLWIGYLQIHARAHGKTLPHEPVLRKANIETRDAVLRSDSTRPRLGKDGLPAARWDGVTKIRQGATGREVPDPAATVQDLEYLRPRQATWPAADFIVGNPPFIGAGPMRFTLGDGYAETLRKTYKEIPASADYVMYWWWKAAQKLSLTRPGEQNGLRRFGFVTTNSVKQTFNRRVIEQFMGPGKNLSMLYAIPDHPWVDAEDGAAVRIAMTVMQQVKRSGIVEQVVSEVPDAEGEYEITTRPSMGLINPDLTVGTDVTAAVELKAMEKLSSPGVKLHGSGFIIPRTAVADPKTGIKPPNAEDLGLGKREGLTCHIRTYRNGRDLTSRPREVMVIDLFGLSAEQVRQRYPEVYEHVLLTVKPERDAKAHSKDGAGYAKLWWQFGKPRQELRKALHGLSRYIATVETSKHRFFQFLDADVLPDNKLIAIADDDAYTLGVLSSRLHMEWALAQGSRLGVGNDPVYVKSRCFETFPFPLATPAQQARIRAIAENLDAHRKARLAEHPTLTMTEMYNALEAFRRDEELSGKLVKAFQQGMVGTLKQYHDELDAAVAEAYGWPTNLSTPEVLAHLTELNRARSLEEVAGRIHYLRPEYQDPAYKLQTDLGMNVAAQGAVEVEKMPFPADLPGRIQAVRDQIVFARRPLSLDEVASAFREVTTTDVADLVETLVVLGQARVVEGGEVRYVA